MAKLRYVLVPLVLVAASWFYETSGYRRYGADEPGVAPEDVSWLAVIGRAAVGTVAYFALEAIRRRQQQRRHGQVTGPGTP